MKNYFKDTIRLFAALMLLAVSTVVTGCSKENDTTESTATEGVVFEFAKRTIYSISDMTEMAFVKITLSQNGKNFDLPSMGLSGTAELVSTKPYHLSPGTYTFESYIAYDSKSNQLFKVEAYANNLIEVKANELTVFDLPIEVRVVEFPKDYYRNAIYGLCVQLFGEDNKDKWPWDFEKEDLRDMQKRHKDTAYIEFEEDETTHAIISLSGLNLTGEDFASVTEVSFASIPYLQSLIQITLSNMPNLTKVSGLNVFTRLEGLTIYETGISELPEDLAQCKELIGLTVVKSKLTEVPAMVTQFENLRSLHLSSNQITSVDVQLGGLTELEDIDFDNNPITSIGENVFSKDHKINNITMHDTQLSSLPAVLGQMTYLRGVNVSNCKFTSVPAAVANNAHLRTLNLSGNQITSINAANFTGMTNLMGLYLSGMKLTAVPKLALPGLIELGVENCGLTALPDLTGMANLRSLKAGGNDFTSFASIDFSANPELRSFSLANSAKLTSLPSDANFKVIKTLEGAVKNFAFFDVSDCPLLNWTSPASWKGFDAKLGQEISDGSYEHLYGPTNGRVGITRTNSPGVKLGK